MSKIIADIHEPKDIKEELDCIVEHLAVGDYLIIGEKGRVVVERKEVNDLVNSVRDNRFWEQLQGLKVLEEEEGFRPLVLIEGEQWKLFKYRKIKLPQWFGLLQAITVGFGIPVIYTRDRAQTIAFLKILKNRLGREVPYTRPVEIKKGSRTPVEQAEDMLCALDLIGRKKAQEILTYYSIKELVMNPQLLLGIRGIGEKVCKNFIDVINSRR